MPKSIFPSTYKSLFQKVKQTLILGQQKIEAEKVKIYWETGNLIQMHVKQNKDRAEYGTEVIKKLSKDLGVEDSTLQRCVQFAKKYTRSQIVAGRRQFTWSHYRKLIAIPDDQERLMIEEKARRNGWTSDELVTRVKIRKFNDAPSKSKSPPPQTLLSPKRGTLYTYRIIQRPLLGGRSADSPLQLDLGFGVFRDVEARTAARFSADQIVESRKKVNSRERFETVPYTLTASDRAPRELFTYAALVERVVDGDTLKVKIDLGFGIWHRETLRLRDIDCPELDTKEGAAARTFVQALLKEAAWIILYTTRSDKYDRYLADVFIPQGEEPDPATDGYLNNLLLEGKYALRV